MEIDKAQTEPDKKGLKHKTQKEEINDEIEQLLQKLKSQQKRQKK